MLRRKPTAITLTTEDIAIYEDARQREAEAAASEAMRLRAQGQGRQGTPGQKIQNKDPNDELRPLPGDKARIRTREERLGMGGGS